MPQRIVCSNCSYVFYEDMELVQPKEILFKFDHRCPRCMAKLDLREISVRAKMTRLIST